MKQEFEKFHTLRSGRDRATSDLADESSRIFAIKACKDLLESTGNCCSSARSSAMRSTRKFRKSFRISHWGLGQITKVPLRCLMRPWPELLTQFAVGFAQWIRFLALHTLIVNVSPRPNWSRVGKTCCLLIFSPDQGCLASLEINGN